MIASDTVSISCLFNALALGYHNQSKLNMFMQHVQFTVKKKITKLILIKNRQLTLLQMKTQYFQTFNLKFMNMKTIYILEM